MAGVVPGFSREVLDSHDVFLFDCDGVLFRGTQVLEGVPATLAALQKQHGKRVFYVTNNATKSREDNAEKLRHMGIEASHEQVICSSFSASAYVKRQGLKRVFVVGESGLSDELLEIGLEVVKHDDPMVADAVVAGLDRHFTYDKLAAALHHIQRGAVFVATNRDSTYPADGGRMMPGAGSLIAALECCSGVKPHVTGKPSDWFVAFVKSVVAADASRCLMIGDRLDTDVAFGLLAGFKTMLVTETGVHSLAHLEAAPPTSRPHYSTGRVADLLAHL